MKTYFVLGFLFSPNYEEVVLIKKLRPDWQKGLLNGVGGKAQNQETLKDAMKREFSEEAGLEISNWEEVGVLDGKDYKVVVFTKTSSNLDLIKAKTDEIVNVYKVSNINELKLVPGVNWLIPICIHKDFFSFTASYNTKIKQ